MVDMPVCIHGIPVKYACYVCNRKDKKQDVTLEDCLKKIAFLEEEVNLFKSVIKHVRNIEEKGNEAIELFIRKAHDLKKIDAKRDDVINLLCQKVEMCFQLLKELKDANTRR